MISHSQIQKMDYCPKSYNLHYERKVRLRHTPPYFVFGSVVEAGLYRMLAGRDARDVPRMEDDDLADGLAAADEKMYELEREAAAANRPVSWESPEARGEALATISGLLHAFRQPKVHTYLGPVKHPHRPVTRITEWSQEEVGGFIDLVADVRLPVSCPDCFDAVQAARLKAERNGRMVYPPCASCLSSGTIPGLLTAPAVIDVKTAAQRWSAAQALADAQVSFYGWAGSTEATHGAYLVGVKSAKPFWQFHAYPFQPARLASMDQQVAAHVLLKNSGLRPMRPGYAGKNCSMCDFVPDCYGTPEEAVKVLDYSGVVMPWEEA